MSELNTNDLVEKLISHLRGYNDSVVAFSGGVDSAVVAAAAFHVHGERAVAVTGLGPAVADQELQDARSVAASIGIRHVELPTQEIDDPNYVRNDAKRCYHCKSNLYAALRRWCQENAFENVLSGTNLDDLGDYRPGLEAAKEFRILAPLADLQIGKSGVRALARHFGLSVASKPASPCLASRIAYGQAVTQDRLQTIERSESFLRSLGFQDVRVRMHADSMARLELHVHDWPKLLEPGVRDTICESLTQFGFQFVTMDLMSRQSGSLNRVLPVLADL